MATPVNMYGDITGTTAFHLEANALEHAKPFHILELGAKKLSHPKNGTKTVKHRRAIPFAAADTPLSEGVPPSATPIRYEELEISIAQFGGYSDITDVVVDLHTTPVLKDINELNAEQVVKTREALLYGMVKGNPNVLYAGNVAALTDVVTPLAKSDQERAVRSLQRNKARRFTQIVTGGMKVSTQAIEGGYICFTHTDTEAAIRAMEGFVPVSKYGSMTTFSEHEFGAVDNVRYVSSPDLDAQLNAGGNKALNMSDAGVKADVYNSVYCGQDAYAIVELVGKGAIQPRVRNVGKPTDTDPLGQKGSVGWLMWTAVAILNSDWIVTVKHTVKD